MFTNFSFPTWGFALLGLVSVIALMMMYRSLLQKVGPNQALIVYGPRGTRVVAGGALFVNPITEQYRIFSLELMSFPVAPHEELYTQQGVAVSIEAVSQVKVRSANQQHIRTAAEQFLSKTLEEREFLIRQVMEGHVRTVLGKSAVEELIKESGTINQRIIAGVAPDLDKMGLEVVSFTLKNVRDTKGYIENLGRPHIEQVERESAVAAALARCDREIQEAIARRETIVAKSAAEQVVAQVETESRKLQSNFQHQLEMQQASAAVELKERQAQADKAYELTAMRLQQEQVTTATRGREAETTALIRVQEAEVQRRELELLATVIKQAEAERRCIETLAEADRQRLILEAQGQAEAIRLRNVVEAEVERKMRLTEVEVERAVGAVEAERIRTRGQAEAEALLAQGKAEAEAMQVKAAAYRNYNAAAILDQVITTMPEIVRALTEPLAKVNKIDIVSGNAEASAFGVSRFTSDLLNIADQAPALFERLGGVSLTDLRRDIPATGDESRVDDLVGVHGE